MSKAIRATIRLGNLEIDVFQIPNGEYRLSQTQVTKAINKSRNSLLEFLGGKSLQALPYKDFRCYKFKIEGNNSSITGVPLELASAYWSYWAFKGNAMAQALTFACVTEALERRADKAFDVQRTEEERNFRFTIRTDGILSRKFWVNSIKHYVNNNEVNHNLGRWAYINVSNYLNKALFGITTKEVRNHYSLKKNEAIRDYLPVETLRLIDRFEDLAAIKVLNKNVNPQDAIKIVIEEYGIKPSLNRL